MNFSPREDEALGDRVHPQKRVVWHPRFYLVGYKLFDKSWAMLLMMFEF